MRPLIGITVSAETTKSVPPRDRMYLNTAYSDAVFAAGGLPYPLPLPAAASPAVLDELLAPLAGLVFTGGDDLDPRHYGAERHPATEVMHPRRDAFELAFFRRADAARLPILAICLGCQVAHVARGGRLHQHIDDLSRTPALAHRSVNWQPAYHAVRIAPDSHLARIVGTTELETNSRHHQAVDADRPGRGLRTVAHAADGVLEASEDFTDGRFLLAVQWHPEDMIDRSPHLRLFEALVSAARGA